MATKRNGPQGQTRTEIESTFGFVPDFYSVMPEHVIDHAWGIQRDLELSETVLDNKTKELIGLALAGHIKCRYCVYFHASAARAFGATDEEMREAIAVGGMTVLFSNSLTGMQVDYERFCADVDRALDYVRTHPAAAPKKPSNRPRA
jgi:AhpD family alkylhydroperoxidase